jgi:hypothetical protein
MAKNIWLLKLLTKKYFKVGPMLTECEIWFFYIISSAQSDLRNVKTGIISISH